MKKYGLVLAAFLSLALVTGCQTKPQAETTTEVTRPAQPVFPLMDQAEAVGTTGNLAYIPNAHVETMACPEIRLFGNGLLLYEVGMDGRLQMKRVSLEDGALLAEAIYDVDPAAQVQIGNGCLGICDRAGGQVLILNEELKTEQTYQVPIEGETWILNQELETLYIFFQDQGLQVRDLGTGQTRWLLENAAFVQPCQAENGYVVFSYADRADQMTYARSLDLSTATMETLPVNDGFISGVRSGERWLLEQEYAPKTFLCIGDSAGTFEMQEGIAQLLANRGQLLVIPGDYRNFYLYQLDGTFISHCALPQMEYGSVGTNLVWSGYWEGYFFRDTYDGVAHLMFWDPSVSPVGENLTLAPMETQASAHVVEQALYDQAAELSRRFGVDIRIAEQCALEYTHYEGKLLDDPQWIRSSLEVLERALSDYPEGFFRQLHFGNYRQIRIELVDGLLLKGDVDDLPPVASGFADSLSDHHIIVLDATGLKPSTVYHEFSHIIDKRLDWDAHLRADALFSEEGWFALQPAGFKYADSYANIPDSVLRYEYSGYFARRYGMTFPTEDRATLMPLAFLQKDEIQGNAGMRVKMEYYAACIRDCFDTTGWPEKTAWE